MRKFAWDKAHTDEDGNFSWVPDHDKARASRDDAEYDEKDHVLRWKSNGNVPPADCVAHWQFLGLTSTATAERCDDVRQAELNAFFEEYRKNQKPASEEELFEMRAAFGPGEVVVDVISGRRTQL